jgi:hypothetical protein
MGQKLSISARREITKKQSAEYWGAGKKAKGVMLDQLVATTGWSRVNAMCSLTAAGKRKGPSRAVRRTPRSPTYAYDTLKLLIQVWNLAGRPSGKYLTATIGLWLPKLKQHGERDVQHLSDHSLIKAGPVQLVRSPSGPRRDTRLPRRSCLRAKL